MRPVAGFFEVPVRCGLAARQHRLGLRKYAIVVGLPDAGIASKVVVMLEEHHRAMGLFAENAVGRPRWIAKFAQFFLERSNPDPFIPACNVSSFGISASTCPAIARA